jgi:hypothetical protein
MTDKKPLSPSEAILASRRNFLRQSVVGAGAVAGATLGRALPSTRKARRSSGACRPIPARRWGPM